MKYFAEGRTTPAAPSAATPPSGGEFAILTISYFAKEDSLTARDRLQAPESPVLPEPVLDWARRHRAHKRRVSEAPA